MQDKTDKVAAAEDDGVGSRLEVREMLAIYNNDPGEAEIYGGAQEGRGNGQGDEVNEKIIVIERSVVNQDSTNIANNLKDLMGPVSEGSINTMWYCVPGQGAWRSYSPMSCI